MRVRAADSPAVTQLATEEDFHALVASKDLAFVYFHATWFVSRAAAREASRWLGAQLSLPAPHCTAGECRPPAASIHSLTRSLGSSLNPPRCGSCKMIGPKFVRFAEARAAEGAAATFAAILMENVSPDFAKGVNVNAMPTFLALRRGVESGRTAGPDTAKLAAFIEAQIADAK